MGAELGRRAAQITLHGLRLQRKTLGRFGIRAPEGNLGEDVELACRQGCSGAARSAPHQPVGEHPQLGLQRRRRRWIRGEPTQLRMDLTDFLGGRPAQAGKVHVRIGKENDLPALRNMSLVTTTYRFKNQVVGVLGVLGTMTRC